MQLEIQFDSSPDNICQEINRRIEGKSKQKAQAFVWDDIMQAYLLVFDDICIFI